MNYLVMDRASEAAANDLAEVRKLIEGMNTLVYSQIQQQQAFQQSKQNEHIVYSSTENVEKLQINEIENTLAATAMDINNLQSPPTPLPQTDNNKQAYSVPILQNGVIVQITHLTFNRVLYFQLTPVATIEPIIDWLRTSYQDAGISGMVLQYKGFDGLWKCLLNRDDSLRRILKQHINNNTMLQLRIPRKQDLLSSGYTDQRLLALTKIESM